MQQSWHRLTLWHELEWAKVLRRDPCVYCGERSESVEHVDPHGSRSAVTNGAGACRSCNSERGSVPLLFYLVWRTTARDESFPRWNFRLHADRIRELQLLHKARRLAVQAFKEERAKPLTATMTERLSGLLKSLHITEND